MIVLVALVFIGTIAYEAPPLIRKQEWKELGVFGGLMLIAMALSFAYLLDLPLPNPNPLIKMLVSPVSKLVNQWLA